ncbi:hypothetical protein F511_12633 [Dorcoceras hygrometricum]|uniref:Uncharacterized protein n=1 Tax=Dorcoceras hygrometricum TaxID=472368 RepID=A0A2Z7CMU7_9LAMI|nr:hypothetical protein F511_12633 [Dorcoceras hygrometricum]
MVESSRRGSRKGKSIVPPMNDVSPLNIDDLEFLFSDDENTQQEVEAQPAHQQSQGTQDNTLIPWVHTEVTFSFKDLRHRGPDQPGRDQDYGNTIISLHQILNSDASKHQDHQRASRPLTSFPDAGEAAQGQTGGAS